MLHARAQWWFSQMRRKVEDAPDASSGASTKVSQSPATNGMHDSFQI